MQYQNVKQGYFLRRLNRFVANVLLDGTETLCHVKNTGRCRELLVPGAEVWLEPGAAPQRKTGYDLIAVRKGERLINMDSAAPNAVFGEWLRAGGLGTVPEVIRPECTHGDSRFDFYLEAAGRKVFAEVKGVTLESEGVAMFPDAPTQRGVKHLRGLIRAVEEGYDACAVFIVQMTGVRYLCPNRATHPQFADALAEAAEAGVRVLALDCHVTENSLSVRSPVEVRVEQECNAGQSTVYRKECRTRHCGCPPSEQVQITP